MATPRVKRGGAISEGGQLLAAAPLPTPHGPGRATADAGARDSLLCHPLQELHSLLETRVIDEDEASHDAKDMLNELGLELLGAGYGRSETDAAGQREWHVRDLAAVWRKEGS